MLVYANSLTLNPQGGHQTLQSIIAKWMSQRAKASSRDDAINPDEPLIGVTSTQDIQDHPYYFSATLTHPDNRVYGRQWITEIGIHQPAPAAPYTCSIVLKVEDVSSLIKAPINASRPRLVQMLIEQAHPIGQTAGLKVKSLDMAAATAYRSECLREDRAAPIVLISHPNQGPDIIDPERLRATLIGLSDVVLIDKDTNTFTLSDAIGKEFAAYAGAINIIFPPRNNAAGRSAIYTTRLTLQQLQDMRDAGKTLENEILAIITHQTNSRHLLRHTSPNTVSQAIFQARTSQLLQRSKDSDQSEELKEYVELLQIADQDIRIKDQTLASIRQDHEDLADQLRIMENHIDSLKYALNDKTAEQTVGPGHDLSAVREAIATIISGNPTLQQVIQVIGALYPDRIVVLPSALDSARESDRGGFRHGHRAYTMLTTFADGYWQALASGKGDQIAKACFGYNAFSSNEGEGLTADGNRRRSFAYNGTVYRMIKHLKYGVKDSLADTLRIHYEWIAEEKRLVIGHCGKHLDF